MAKTPHIIIIGAGMVGLTLANALAEYPVKITVVENKKPSLHWLPETLDARVSAINMVSYRILQNVNAWQHIRDEYKSILKKMQVWDSTGGGEVHFDSQDINEKQLGFIIENREITRALWQQCEQLNNIEIFTDVSIETITIDETKVTLKAGQQIWDADLIVGADGANSWLRDALNFAIEQRPYHQHAVIAVLQTEKAHHYTAYQNFSTQGPLGVLPLADHHHVGIVWSTTEEHAQYLIKSEAKHFNTDIENALNFKLGIMKVLTKPISIPLSMRHVKHYVKERAALIGDAAHTIHPLAGQGVNLGLMDAACLAASIQEALEKNRDIGSLRTLRRYERWRKGDNSAMLFMMRGFKDIFDAKSPWLIQLRSQGFNLADKTSILKNCFMRYAMGEHGEVPTIAIKNRGQ